MKIRFTATRVAAQLEITLDVDRSTPSRTERERWAIEEAQLYKAAVEAIQVAPQSAKAIADRLLDGSVEGDEGAPD